MILMTRKESYQMVIEAEIRAQMLYHSLARSFRNPETSAVFQELVMLEKTHEEGIRKAYAAEFAGEEPVIKPQVEVELKDVNLKEPLEVLEFAMGREDIARSAYLQMADASDDADLKALLISFADQEDQHKQLIQAEIQRLQGSMIWFDPSELTGLMED